MNRQDVIDAMAEIIDNGMLHNYRPEMIAEAALDAFLDSLVKPEGKCPHGCYFVKDTHSGLYMETLEMRKK